MNETAFDPLAPFEDELKALYDNMQRCNVVDAFKQLQRVPPKLNPDIIYQQSSDSESD